MLPREVREELLGPVAQGGVQDEVRIVVRGLAREVTVLVVVTAILIGRKFLPDRAFRLLPGEDRLQAQALRDLVVTLKLDTIGGDDVEDRIRIVQRDAVRFGRLRIAEDVTQTAPERRGGEGEAPVVVTVADFPLLDRLRAEAGVELVPSGVEAALRVEIAE